jgi:hypothetical protein
VKPSGRITPLNAALGGVLVLMSGAEHGEESDWKEDKCAIEMVAVATVFGAKTSAAARHRC